MEKVIIDEQNILVEKVNEEVILPSYASIGDAGMDIRASQDFKILPGETKVISTGLKLHIPEGYEVQIRPRSGLSLNTPLRISNAPGTIDSGYKDEIGIIVSNTSPVVMLNITQDPYTKEIKYDLPSYPDEICHSLSEKGNKYGAYIIHKGDRIAQMILCKYAKINFIEVNPGTVQSLGSNRGGGFGHSGLL